MPRKGFTLIELLIVIAIIAIIASVVFVALNPLKRFQDSRDAARWTDINALIDAIKVDQIDNGGSYISAIEDLIAGDIYMVGTASTACNTYNSNCDVNVSGSGHCVDLESLAAEGYLGEVPISPMSSSTQGIWTSLRTGYTLMASSTGSITIQACESENTSDIKIAR